MSMLAAPRRKQKVINLRAKNNEWSNDANKFGQRMLEKMGWSSGRGLGAKENGIVEHVVARYKNDEKGLGFEDKNDQWTKHEDDFNALLANLSNDKSSEEKLHSGVSLEVKSKKSKARIHYHKFTRGKDIARYSEKDLANIFGKKTLKNEDKPAEVLKDDVKTSQVVFTDRGSMVDYFKSKSTFKTKNRNDESTQSTCDHGDSAFQGFAQNDDEEILTQGFGFQSFSFYNQPADDKLEVTKDTENPDSCQSTKKSKKKKKKRSKATELFEEICESDGIGVQNKYQEKEPDDGSKKDCTDETKQTKSKKSKKNKKLQEMETFEEPKPKKKKSKQSLNHEHITVEDDVNTVNDINSQNDVTSNTLKKKKKKCK